MVQENEQISGDETTIYTETRYEMDGNLIGLQYECLNLLGQHEHSLSFMENELGTIMTATTPMP